MTGGAQQEWPRPRFLIFRNGAVAVARDFSPRDAFLVWGVIWLYEWRRHQRRQP